MDARAENALILLEWYKAIGVDEAIAASPSNWFAPEEVGDAGSNSSDAHHAATSSPNAAERETAGPPLNLHVPATNAQASGVNRKAPTRQLPPRLADAPPSRKPPSGVQTPDVMAARELARSAGSLDDLRSLLETFEGCGLRNTANRLCLSRGSADARLMLIGEAPGKEEDAQGAPFVGRAGQLLDRMLAAIELTEADFYVTNLVFWRPPGNRTPSPEEVQVSQPFVERQIELLSPQILVFLGNAAAKQLTGATEGIMKLRGKWLTYPTGPGIPAMAILHPAYLLRTPIAKRLAWRDLLSIREALDRGGA